MKKILLSSVLVTTALLFTGCNSDSMSESECKFNVQTSLDQKEYDTTLDLLNNDCSTVLTDSAKSSNYGFAYLGKAGMDIYNVLSTMVEPGNSSFGSFIQSINEDGNDNSLVYLQKATSSFNLANGNLNCEALDISYSEKDICFYSGITDTLTAAITFNYLTDDLDSFIAGTDNPNDMTASACSLEYSLSGICSNADISNINELTAIVFANTKEYTPLNIEVLGTDTYQYMLKKDLVTNIDTVILTKDYCDINFNQCDILSASCYACPVDKTNSDTELSTLDLLVDSINSGLDTVGVLTDNPDIIQSIDDFKADLGNNGAEITNQDIIDYLNQQ
jgi:hypothetical protein